MGPGAAHVDVERVAVFFGGKLSPGFLGDEIAEFGGFAPELAVLVCMAVGWVEVGHDFGCADEQGNALRYSALIYILLCTAG